MKKLLALLIAILLPAAALAQTNCAELLLTIDEQNCTELIAAMQLFEGDDAEEMNAALARLMNGLGLRLYWQEDAAKLEMLLSNTVLLDLTAVTTNALTEEPAGGQLILTSSLAEGYGLMTPMDDPLNEIDMLTALRVLSGMLSAAQESLADVEMATARGSFSGDAYTGGTSCTTIQLDDSDVAALLSALMTAELQKLLIDAEMHETLLQDWDALHEQAAAANMHRYLIRLVTDDGGGFVGLSAVVLRDGKQLATLSIGMPEESALHVVLGIGMGEENYWYSHVVTWGQGMLAGECIEFTGEKDEAFAFASAVAEELLAHRLWKLTVQTDDQQAAWQFRLDKQGAAVEETMSVLSEGAIQKNEGTLSGHIDWLYSDKQYMTVTMRWQPDERIAAPDTADLTLCDMSSADEEQQALLEEILSELGTNLSMRLLQVIPMNLLLKLM